MTLERGFRLDADLGAGKRATISLATPDDVLRIRWLYHRVYGGSYPFTLVYDPRECAKAIESDRYLWFLARDGDQAVGSLIFTLDRSIFLGKVFGGVVAQEYRGHDLAETMLNFGLDIVVGRLGAARSVYATTRTVNLAPQRLVEKAGFKKLGIFPNVHKVQRSETHTLAVFYGDGALRRRAGAPRLPLLLKPFFSIVSREAGLPDAEYLDLPFPADDPAPATVFEVIQAPQFVLRRFAEVRAAGKLALDFFPFHEPNLLLMSPDGGTEIYVYRSTKDGHCVLTGAFSENMPMGRLLDHGASFLEGMGVRYLEALIDARDAEGVNHALGARFLPSAYYPAMRWDAKGETGRDYVVMSRSLAILDFKGIALQPAYTDYLREYFRLWRELHVGKILP
jgi:RimJ/RimL family protein N-acetyltransferase